MMEVYKVMGKFRMSKKKGEWQRFSKEVIGESEQEAIERIYSLFGSKHRVKRTNISIYDTQKLDEDEVENNLMQKKIEAED